MAVNSPEISFGDSPAHHHHFTASDSRLNLPAATDLCSTPINHSNRKRSFFIDDTGSPFVTAATDVSALDVSGLHYAASPQVPAYPTMSQEMRRVGVDVVWQWNSPKRHLDRNGGGANKDPTDVRPVARKRRKSFSTALEGSGSQFSGGGDKATGFYKIREELMRAKKEDSLFMRLLQEDELIGGVDVNEEERSKEAATVTKTKAEESEIDQSKDATLTRKLSDEFLNDSENDENLLFVSQETEKKVQQQQEEEEQQKNNLKNNPVGVANNNNNNNCNKKTATSVLQSREMSFTNDSFDQYLIDIPFDELLNRNAKSHNNHNHLDETLINTSSSTPLPRVVVGKKGALNRTQSMPPDTGEQLAMMMNSSSSCSSGVVVATTTSSSSSSVAVSSNSSRTMARHESMPTSSRNSGGSYGGGGGGVGVGVGCSSKFSMSNPSLPVMPISSSTESLYSTTCK